MKRTELRRKTPLSRGTKGLKRSRLNRRKRMKATTAKATERYPDGHGVYFDEVRGILGEDTSRWPAVRRVKNPRVLAIFHQLHSKDWIDFRCGPEAHHMAAGYLRGKSDELCALAALSGDWHPLVNTEALPLGHILYLKWKYDRPNCDWVRLTLLFGYFLPDLIVKVTPCPTTP
jgi:hypothetical protein